MPRPPPRPRLKLLERVGVRAVRSARSATEPVDAIHVLNEGERAELRRVERGAVVRAAVAGALAAVLCAAAESTLAPEDVNLGDPVALAWAWAPFGAVLALVTVTEILFLYASSLRAVRDLAYAAGLPLDGDESDETRLALARAALELPSPIEPSFGVDPQHEATRAELLAASLVYKGKTALTNFLFKAFVRRALGRAATRVLLAFTAVPVNAAWNAWVAWAVVREARIRVMGPSAAEELLGHAFAAAEPPSPACAAVLHQAVGCAIVRTRELHPNLVVLLRAMRAHLGPPPPRRLDDVPGFLVALAALPEAERRLTLRCLTIAAIIDGRLSRRERQLLVQAQQVTGHEPDLGPAERLLRDFGSGNPVPAADVLAAG